RPLRPAPHRLFDQCSARLLRRCRRHGGSKPIAFECRRPSHRSNEQKPARTPPVLPGPEIDAIQLAFRDVFAIEMPVSNSAIEEHGSQKEGGTMKRRMSVFGMVALCWAVGTLCMSADLTVGTWKLNAAKSKYTPAEQARFETIKIEAAGDKMKVTLEGTD